MKVSRPVSLLIAVGVAGGTITTGSVSPLTPPRSTVTASQPVSSVVTYPTPQKHVDRFEAASYTVAVPVKKQPVQHKKRIQKVRRNIWDKVAKCESSNNWSYNGSSGYDGGLQFHPKTWLDYKPAGYPKFAYLASRLQQIKVAIKVLADTGWRHAWPACSRQLGLEGFNV